MEVSIIVFYLVGLAIGLLINILVIEIVTKHEKNATFHVGNIRFKPVSEILSEQNEPKISVEDVKKIKILCFLNTSPRNHKFRAVHIQALWGKHCDKLFFASTLTDINIGAIGFNVTDNHDSMWGKEKLMLKFLYNNFINDYDWFYKGDDDTFALVENLRFLVSAYSHDDPIYFGYKFKNPSTKWGYFSGGGGYAMSRKAVRVFVEQVLTNQEFFRRNNEKRSVCHIETDLEVEDIHISVCLDNYNVYAGDSRDLVKRDRFFLWWPGVHLMGKPAWNTWYWDWKYYFNEEGLNCCSNYSVAFHYVHSQRQYGMYFLAYRLQTFGIKRRFPPPPKKKVFSEVAEQLNNERFNITYRGFFKGFNESKREN